MEPRLPTDEDTNRFFDMVVTRLIQDFGYTSEEASSMVHSYYRSFRDEAYCKTINVPVQDDDYFFHESETGMALRIHYYLGLKADPDPRSFLKWRNEYYEQIRKARRAYAGKQSID
jgi:hypothetical protein